MQIRKIRFPSKAAVHTLEISGNMGRHFSSLFRGFLTGHFYSFYTSALKASPFDISDLLLKNISDGDKISFYVTYLKCH